LNGLTISRDTVGARWMMFLKVEGGEVRAERLMRGEIDVDVLSERVLDAREAEGELRKQLLGRGLRATEADGLIDCWRDVFFRKEGSRVLMLLSEEEYGLFCPMDIFPQPKEQARVGIVLTEFPAK
jgi:hypothetical protein